MKIISWNVNGVRAASQKGLLEFIQTSRAEVFCIQETKAQPDQLKKHIRHLPGYQSFWNSAERKGYSGTAIWTRRTPDSIDTLGVEEFDSEGRVQLIHMGQTVLFNMYFPNSQMEGRRLDYKLRFNRTIEDTAAELVKQGKTVILTGDFNVAHRPIDLARPQENEHNPGYLPEERAWMDAFLNHGWVDTFRLFEKGPHHYTWWSYRGGARSRNIGWRLDYFCVNHAAAPQVRASRILPDITGSDHCPVELEIDCE